MKNQKLLDIYAQIPKFECMPGCTKCCGLVPFSKSEWDAIEDKRQCGDDLSCPYIRNGYCDIYEHRPFMCRLFGSVNYWLLKCPHGLGPDTPLTEEQARELTKKYHDMIGE